MQQKKLINRVNGPRGMGDYLKNQNIYKTLYIEDTIEGTTFRNYH